jgi:hypothetical protein
MSTAKQEWQSVSALHESDRAANRNDAPTDDLSVWVDRRRTEIGEYLDRMQARQRRALNLAIVAGACASVLTASAAIGGQRLAKWLAVSFDLSSPPPWQILCVVATLCSLAAAIATQLLKSHNVDERVARAQTARAKLDIIRFGLATGQTTEAHAADEYNASVELSSFITSRM